MTDDDRSGRDEPPDDDQPVGAPYEEDRAVADEDDAGAAAEDDAGAAAEDDVREAAAAPASNDAPPAEDVDATSLTARARAAAPTALEALSVGGAAVVGSVLAVGTAPEVVVAPVARAVTVATPGVVVTAAITLLGDLGDHLVVATAVGLTAALLGAAALGGAALARRRGLPTVLAAWLATTGVAALLAGSLPSAAGAGAGGAVALAFARLTGDVDVDPATRRSVLATAGAALGAGVLGAAYARSRGTAGAPGSPAPEDVPEDQQSMLAAASDRSLDVEGLEPLVSDHFYEVDISQVNPNPAPDEWTLSITGAVGSPTTYDYEDVTGHPAHHRFVSLRCVGESLNGRKLDNALWTGVPVPDLLEGVDPEGEFVMVRAEDGFFEEFPADALSDAMLAYGMNGGSLPRGHGKPARLLVPGHWGEINVKWVTEIEFLEKEQKGYWEQRGWHGTGPVETVAKHWVTNHLEDGRVEVAGAAYAGTRGVERVEVSTDGGETWSEATLSDRLPGEVIDAGGGASGPGPSGNASDTSTDADGTPTTGSVTRSSETARDAWRQWVYRYDPPAGDHEVVVRAVDWTGTLQPETESGAFPTGPTGWVSTTVSRE